MRQSTNHQRNLHKYYMYYKKNLRFCITLLITRNIKYIQNKYKNTKFPQTNYVKMENQTMYFRKEKHKNLDNRNQKKESFKEN